MKYLLAGLGAYSIGVGSYFYSQHQHLNSLLIGWGLGIILMFGSIVLFLSNTKEKK